jgi:Protein of unknown function (DUF3102)
VVKSGADPVKGTSSMKPEPSAHIGYFNSDFNNEAVTAASPVDDGLDIPGFLRRDALEPRATNELAAEQAHPALAEHAAEIRRLGKRVVADIIEIGRRLADCRDNHLAHKQWLPWIEKEFGWSDQTARNFINVYEQSKSKNFLNLDLPISSLYLLAAPSTPEAARTEIIARAEAGEAIKIADVKQTIETAKGRKPRNLAGAKIFRGLKLGEEVVAPLKGTSLDSAEEMDELIILNRGAAAGELTDPVKELVALAVAGEAVSATGYRESGAAYRREEVNVANSRKIVPQSASLPAPNTPIEGLKSRLKHFETQSIELRSENRELKAALTNKLGMISNKRFYAELERRLSPQFLRTHHVAMKAIARALDASLGPTLEGEAMPIADTAVAH